MPERLDPHEERERLLEELHARPRPALPAPCAVTRIDLQVDQAGARAHIAALSEVKDDDLRQHSYRLGGVQIVFERRTEFVSYTVIDPAPSAAISDRAPLPEALAVQLEALPGRLVSAIRLDLEKSVDGAPAITAAPNEKTLAASTLRAGAASLVTDYFPREDGFIHFLVFDSTPSDAVRGRMVQRILEMEAYRAAAMLALPIARRANEALDRLDAALNEVSDRIASGPHASKDRDILQRLTRLAGEAERLRAEGDYRFAAARAYGDLVADRNLRLREGRVEGHERIGVFIERRLNPALRTCQSVSERQHSLAHRIDRAVQLLTTRVQVDLEDQNAALLDTMNRRAAVQLRLQEAVEALSAVAITYYGVGLVHYLAEAAAALGWPVDPALYAGVATPIVFLSTIFGVRSLRLWLSKHAPS